jgi:hypothetical protein
MVACHWKRLSPIGPAEQDEGGSRPRSINSCKSREHVDATGKGGTDGGLHTLLIRFKAMMLGLRDGSIDC